MSRYSIVEQLEGVFTVMKHGVVIGHVARGDLHELRDGRLTIRGSYWVVIGFEYIGFRKMVDATDALFHAYRHLHDAANEIADVRRLESIVPIYRSVSRRTTDQSVKDLSRDVGRSLRASKRDYHDSMHHAGLSKYVH